MYLAAPQNNEKGWLGLPAFEFVNLSCLGVLVSGSSFMDLGLGWPLGLLDGASMGGWTPLVPYPVEGSLVSGQLQPVSAAQRNRL